MNYHKKDSVFLCQPHFDKPIVFCFHHAGGNARVYQQWTSCEKVDFVPIEYPGHGFLTRKPCHTDIEKVSDEFARFITELIGERKVRFSLFGHSLGAIIAFCVAEKLKKYNFSPVCLQVAGRHAPQETDKSEYRTSMGQTALLKEIKAYGYTPPELLENEEYCNYMLPIMFHDYQMSESFKYRHQKLSIPIMAYYGNEDDGAEKEEMNKWQEVTDNLFRIKGFIGGHFFLLDNKYNFNNILADDMLSLVQKNKTIHKQTTVCYEKGAI